MKQTRLTPALNINELQEGNAVLSPGRSMTQVLPVPRCECADVLPLGQLVRRQEAGGSGSARSNST